MRAAGRCAFYLLKGVFMVSFTKVSELSAGCHCIGLQAVCLTLVAFSAVWPRLLAENVSGIFVVASNGSDLALIAQTFHIHPCHVFFKLISLSSTDRRSERRCVQTFSLSV